MTIASNQPVEVFIKFSMLFPSHMSAAFLHCPNSHPNVDTLSPLCASANAPFPHLMAEGKSTEEIPFDLDVSGKTIETHRRNLMAKLKLFSVAELTKYAIREGVTSM